MIHRNRQIKRAERGAQGIMARWSAGWSGAPGATVSPEKAAIMDSIEALSRQFRCIGVRTDKDELKRLFQAIESGIQGYYAHDTGITAESITGMLLNSGFIDDLLKATELAITEDWPMPLQRTLAGILHYSIRLIWVYHTGKSRLLSDKYKGEALTKLHDLCDEVSPGLFELTSRIRAERVEVYHRLLSAREAMLSIRDRSTWSDVGKRVVKKLLSPVGMFQILQDFWRNAPQGWYLKLVSLEQMVGALTQLQPEQLAGQISDIQKQALKEKHWYPFNISMI